MESFNKQYNSKFVLDITILKNYSDSNKNVEKFKKAFGIDEARLKEIENQLNLAITIEK